MTEIVGAVAANPTEAGTVGPRSAAAQVGPVVAKPTIVGGGTG